MSEATPRRDRRTAMRLQRTALDETAHRPWPLPALPWLQAQTWTDLLFVHWAVEPAVLRPHVPRGLELETFDGRAWLGVTPFRVRHLRPRGLPPVPRLSAFAEMNVRTYVRRDDRPGVLFLTLECSSRLAVAAARTTVRLPYHRADMDVRDDADGWTAYRSTRPGGPRFAGRYRGHGPTHVPPAGSLEAFLVERYCLYTVLAGAVLRTDIHHRPWAIRPGELDAEVRTGLDADLTSAPLVHHAPRQDVVVWPPVPAR